MKLLSAKLLPHTRNLGSKLLAFILNLDTSEVDELLVSGGQISEQQQAVLDQSEQILLQAKQGRINNQDLEWHDTMALRNLRFTDGLPVLNGLRINAGGRFQKLETDDPIKRELIEMCVDCYAFTLIPEMHNQFDFARVDLPHFFRSEKMARFLSAVRLDRNLMKLFPDGAEDEFSQSRPYYTSFGHGSGTQLALMPENIIQAGIALMHARNESSVLALQEATCEMLDALRSCLAEEKPLLQVFDIFDLVGLPSDFEVSLGESKLLGIPKGFLRHVPRGARPSQDGEGNFFGGMLQRSCRFDIAIVPPNFEFGMEDEWPIEISLDCSLNSETQYLWPLPW